MKTVSLIMLAVVGLSLQANAASNVSTLNGDGSSIANSLAPSGIFNAGAVSSDTSYLTTMAPSLSGGSVVSAPIQNFSATVANSTSYNDSIGAQTIKVGPEPTTLALTTLGGLSALVFTRHFRKSHRV
jgi:hypothetical protein